MVFLAFYARWRCGLHIWSFKVSEKALIAFVFIFALSLTIYVSLSLPHPFKALEQREKLLIAKGLITSPIEIYPIFIWVSII